MFCEEHPLFPYYVGATSAGEKIPVKNIVRIEPEVNLIICAELDGNGKCVIDENDSLKVKRYYYTTILIHLLNVPETEKISDKYFSYHTDVTLPDCFKK